MSLIICFTFLAILRTIRSADNLASINTDQRFESNCMDTMPEKTCLFWKRLSACQLFPKRMVGYCKKTCEFCEGVCEDHIKVRCRWLAAHGTCTTHEKAMRKWCPKTCELCYIGKKKDSTKARSPPKCASSKYGCCWNNYGFAKGNNGAGCPVCKNRKNWRFCLKFKIDCFQGSRNKPLMDFNCAATCGLCKKHSILEKNSVNDF